MRRPRRRHCVHCIQHRLACCQQLLKSDTLKAWRLADAALLAPEANGGLKIEGLADSADGQLLIGFRNPVREGKALVVVLRNPQQVASGSAATFGPPIGLDLGGRGVRAIERLDSGYLIVAGPNADEGDFWLYRWSGQAGDAPQRVPDLAFGTLRPEAIVAWPQTGLVLILSDDAAAKPLMSRARTAPPRSRPFAASISGRRSPHHSRSARLHASQSTRVSRDRAADRAERSRRTRTEPATLS